MNGGGYLTLLLVKSEEEKQRREDEFRKAILPFIQDYDGLWGGFVKEILGRYEKLKALDLDKATNIELLDNFEETINTCRRMWEIHMYMMYGTYTAYILFENMCRELAGIDDTSPLFHNLVSGFRQQGLSGGPAPVGVFQAGPDGGTGRYLPGERAGAKSGARLEASAKGQGVPEGFHGLHE